jgi:hypothetical protein
VAPDITPPGTAAGASPSPNAAGWNNTNVTVSLAAHDEANGSGVRQIAYSTSGAQAGSGIVASDSAEITINAEGETVLAYFATDRAGNVESPRTLTIRIDKTPPAVTGWPASGCTLWPVNHKLVAVAVVVASDGLSGMASFNVEATSSEPATPGETDAVIAGTSLDARTISLRAERLGNGSGRVYGVTAVAADRAGNTATALGTCVVPHDVPE